jgi:hypothetical protein
MTTSDDQKHNPLMVSRWSVCCKNWWIISAGKRWRSASSRCFSSDPSIASSLKFLRKTPWAREKVEGMYLFMLREQARTKRASEKRPPLN